MHDLLDAGLITAIETVLPCETAALLLERWSAVKAETESLRWLADNGLSGEPTLKAMKYFGAKLKDLLSENPYRLTALLPWRHADQIGQTLGVPLIDPRRLVGAVKAACYRLTELGDTIADHAWYVQSAATLLGCESAGRAAVEHAVCSRTLVERHGALQPLGAANIERDIEARIAAMLSPGHGSQDVEKGIDAAGGGGLTLDQRNAVATLLRSSVAILTGGAGTGKTTVLRVFVAAASNAGAHIVQVAVAGRAVGRMREASGAPACTIAAFLHQVQKAPLSAPCWLVVDEASMVDCATAWRLLNAIPPGSRVLLIGDAAQLPPLSFGLFFHSAVKSSRIPVVALTKILRQDDSSGIPDVANAIRKGAVPTFADYQGKGTGVSFIDCPSDDLSTVVSVWSALSTDGSECQVLSPLKNGPMGTTNINQVLRDGRGGEIDPLLEEWGFRRGDPIVGTRNDYHLGIWNGSLGRFNRGVVADGKLDVECVIDGEAKSLPESYLPDVELAYALTVHKSQGSAFERVIVPISASRILDRALVYTAVTRARRQCVLVGDRGAMERAIRAPSSVENRRVGLDL